MSRGWSRTLITSLSFLGVQSGCGIGDQIYLGIAAVAPRDAGGDGPAVTGSGGARTETGSGGAGAETGSGGSGLGPPFPAPDASKRDTGASVPICGTRTEAPVTCSISDSSELGTAVEKWRYPLASVTYDLHPLVANLTDDNADGVVDTCDVPDVLVTTGTPLPTLVMLSGATGFGEVTFDVPVDPSVAPAVGDLDGDGHPEIVAVTVEGKLVAFTPDGHVLWVSVAVEPLKGCNAIALYDLEGDGTTEILLADAVFEGNGKLRFGTPYTSRSGCNTPTAADLDGDGNLEVLMNFEVLRGDGTQVRLLGPSDSTTSMVANTDADDRPEIVTLQDNSLVVYDDGSSGLPDGGAFSVPVARCGNALPALADVFGGGGVDALISSCESMRLFRISGTGVFETWHVAWTPDESLSGTLFDLRGNGVPVAIVSHGGQLAFLDGRTGTELGAWRDGNAAYSGSPIVVDADADGSADVLFVVAERDGTTSLVAVSESRQRWKPARRIWNQLAYHVNNVDEDGALPHPMKTDFERSNVFYANARLQDGRTCSP